MSTAEIRRQQAVKLLLEEAGVVLDVTTPVTLESLTSLTPDGEPGAFLVRCAAALLGGPDIKLEELAEAPEHAYTVAVEALRIARGTPPR